MLCCVCSYSCSLHPLRRLSKFVFPLEALVFCRRTVAAASVVPAANSVLPMARSQTSCASCSLKGPCTQLLDALSQFVADHKKEIVLRLKIYAAVTVYVCFFFVRLFSCIPFPQEDDAAVSFARSNFVALGLKAYYSFQFLAVVVFVCLRERLLQVFCSKEACGVVVVLWMTSYAVLGAISLLLYSIFAVKDAPLLPALSMTTDVTVCSWCLLEALYRRRARRQLTACPQ